MHHHYIQFFTATILWWKHLLKPDKYKQVIVDSLRFLVRENRVRLYGFVIMPNHIHLVWKIDARYRLDEVQRDFLKYTAQQFRFDLQEHHPAVLARFEVNLADRRYQFWERRPLSVDLYGRRVIEQKLDYLHANPVQAHWRLASDPAAYPWTSYRFYETGTDEFGFLTHYMEDC